MSPLLPPDGSHPSTSSDTPRPAPVPGSVPVQLPLPAALLCDMDGTLVDTERDWLDTIAALLRTHGAAAGDDDVAAFAGLTVDDAAELVRRRVPLSGTAGGKVAEWLSHDFTARVHRGVTVQPGALRLLDRARALGVPVALVTASERPVADLVLRETLGTHRFAYSVASGEAVRDKPHPDPYVAAAAALGVAAGDCLAVEDTPAGASAALAAGCRILAVPTVCGIPSGPRVRFASSLTDVDLIAPA